MLSTSIHGYITIPYECSIDDDDESSSILCNLVVCRCLLDDDSGVLDLRSRSMS